MKAKNPPEYWPESGYACGLVLKTADFSVHVPLQPHPAFRVCGYIITSVAQLRIIP